MVFALLKVVNDYADFHDIPELISTASFEKKHTVIFLY